MASEVGICNSALMKIGATTITSLTEGSKNANACNEQYAKLRDDLLRSHTWNFATKRVKLAQLASTPTFEFDFEYQLPADWLRTVAVYDNSAGTGVVPYRIEGLSLLADATEAWLRYVRRVDDPNDMPADFRQTLSALLARELAVPIAQSNTLHQMMAERFKSANRQARSVDAIEDYAEAMPAGRWVEARN